MEIKPDIKTLRTRKGYTQQDLGEMIGVSSQIISRYEAGDKQPKVDRLYDLADALGVSPVDLLIGELQKNLYGAGKVCPWLSAEIDSLIISASRERPKTRAAYLLLKKALRLITQADREIKAEKAKGG